MARATKSAEPVRKPKNGTLALLEQMRQKRQPVELSINGKAKVVIEDEGSYQRLVDLVERVDTIAAVKESMKSFERGEGRPALKALEELRQKYGIPG